MSRRKSLKEQSRHDTIKNPPCPKCGGDSCEIMGKYSCHKCDHTWALCEVRRVTSKKDKDTSTSEDVQVTLSTQPAEPELLPGQKVVNPENMIDIPEPKPAEPEPETEVEPTPVKTALALSAAQAQLESLYEQLNKKLFGGNLPSIVITIQTKGRKQAKGWYAPERWEDGEKQANSEINFCAEHLRDGREEITETLREQRPSLAIAKMIYFSVMNTIVESLVELNPLANAQYDTTDIFSVARIETAGAFIPFSLKSPNSTTAALADRNAATNTSSDKRKGTMIYNSDTKVPVWADGNTDTSVWVDATGATAHTPIA